MKANIYNNYTIADENKYLLPMVHTVRLIVCWQLQNPQQSSHHFTTPMQEPSVVHLFARWLYGQLVHVTQRHLLYHHAA
jgi:hypothetical protein